MKKEIDIVHIYYGTQGVSGLYIDEIYNSLKKQNFKQQIFVSYYYPFKYGSRIFFKYTDLASGIKNSRARKYLRAIELVLGLFYVIFYIMIKQPKIVNYSLNTALWIDVVLVKLIRLLSKSKIVLTCHDVVPFAVDNNDCKRQMNYRQKVFDVANYLLVHNKNSVEDLEMYYKIDKSKIIYHLFPIMDLNAINLNKESIQKNYDFAFVGHLRYEKGIELLIEAWKIFNEEYPQATLLIAGNSPQKMKFLDNLDQYNVDLKLQFLMDDEYIKYIKSSNTILLPYNKGTNSGVVYNLVNLNVNIIYSDLPMFTTNSLLDKDGLFKSGNVNDLISRLKFYYKKDKIESSNVEYYRSVFDNQVLEVYNKVLST